MMYMLIIFSNFGVKASIEKGYGNTTQDYAAHGGLALGCKNIGPIRFRVGCRTTRRPNMDLIFIFYMFRLRYGIFRFIGTCLFFCLGINVFSMTIVDWLGPLGGTETVQVTPLRRTLASSP